MSYASNPRLNFFGQFQADVSTVNNDPRHFESASFEPRFQEFQTKNAMNGWWNPIGTGIFRFGDCRVQSAVGPDGWLDADPVVGFVVGNAPDRASGKIVDIDPDWQLASILYGLGVSIADPSTGKLVLTSDFVPAPFRDLWFSRGGGSGDSGASAMWQSELTNLRWQLDGVESPILRALAEASRASGRLSIRITTYAYQTSPAKPDFTYGSVTGSIGPARPGEPATFIAGRRFMPGGAALAGGAPCTSANGMTTFSAQIDGDNLVADLSNALPLGNDGGVAPLGNLHFAMLRREDIYESALVGAPDYVALDVVDASANLLQQHGGLQTIHIPSAIRTEICERPLALVLVGPGGTLGAGQVMMREVPEGRNVQADVFSFRIDPNEPTQNLQTVPLFASRYGVPIEGAAIAFQPGPPTPDAGDTPVSATPGATPKAAIPIYNSPVGILSFDPPVAKTSANGWASVTVRGPARMGAPRKYIDGQLYAIPFNFADAPATIFQTFDQLSILVFSTFDAPKMPSWADVQPILRQYANLYPIMSKGLFDFSKQEIADANAHLLHFVFSKEVTDPDYMPVTRDLSSGKRRALLAYFASVMGQSTAHQADLVVRAAGRCPFSGVTPSAPPEDVPNKIVFNRARSR